MVLKCSAVVTVFKIETLKVSDYSLSVLLKPNKDIMKEVVADTLLRLRP